MDVVRCVHYFFSRKDAKERRDFFNLGFRRLTQIILSTNGRELYANDFYLHVLQVICEDIFRI